MIIIPIYSYLLSKLNGSSDGSIRINLGTQAVKIPENLDLEMKNFINEYGYLGYHDGWGIIDTNYSPTLFKVGMQFGLNSGSIVRNWTIINDKITHEDMKINIK
jgi:hypothetical protein